MTGGREAIACPSYQTSFDSNGVINSIQMDLTMDCGSFVGECVGDASMAVQFRSVVVVACISCVVRQRQRVLRSQIQLQMHSDDNCDCAWDFAESSRLHWHAYSLILDSLCTY